MRLGDDTFNTDWRDGQVKCAGLNARIIQQLVDKAKDVFTALVNV